jgi:adenine-specific DNA-methyltransferase
MARPSKPESKRPIESYEHKDKQRVNNPPVGLVTPDTDPEAGAKKTYAYDPHLDPQLVWAGKAEHLSFEVPTVSLHVHERIDARSIIDAVKRREGSGAVPQMNLFDTERQEPLRQAVEFYQHAHGWSNRMVAGDSLLVMNSLIQKEGLAGKVQMVYLDPPYGIKYGSNFQPFVNKRDVKDGKDDDLTSEPEQVLAFRDTWELGIHSYLTYLRDRLLLARELLTESGSVFVQISDENVHRVRELMDEIYGSECFVSLVNFATTTSQTSKVLPTTTDYLLWYCRCLSGLKYHTIYMDKNAGEDGGTGYTWIELQDGTRRPATIEEISTPSKRPAVSRMFMTGDLTSQRQGRPSGPGSAMHYPLEVDGLEFEPKGGRGWSTTKEGMDRVISAKRVLTRGHGVYYIRYLDDFPAVPVNNNWLDTSSGFMRDKVYVVQTNRKVIERCLLMTTDPGDLVFDPTCGSGTTAFVAEQWGRRWITCDTSRVALTLAKQRLMTAVYDYYELAHPKEGVGSGFRYKTVPHVTLKSIANNPDIKEGMSRAQIDAAIARHAPQETLYDQPIPDRKKHRVSGPFTVEAVPAASVVSVEEVLHGTFQPGDASIARSGETLRQGEWRDELLRCGIRGKNGQHIRFARLEPLPGCRYLHADGETRPSDEGADHIREQGPGYGAQRIVVAFGPNHAPLEQRQVSQAIEEAQNLVPRPKLIVFAAFQFDPEAAKDIDETNWPGVVLLKAQMNADLLTDDLKKKRSSNESFWLIGQPDVVVDSEEWIVDRMNVGVAPCGIVAKLSGVDRLAEVNGLGRDDLSLCIAIAQRRDLWLALANDAGGGVDSGKHRRGTGTTRNEGVPALPGHCPRFPGRIGDAADFVRQLDLLTERERRDRIERLRGSGEIADRARQIAASLPPQLTTIHYSQVTVQGFDYYNTKTGGIESGGNERIAVWLLDTDYDGRSLYPRQVFFPMAGPNEGWARLAKNLKAEIDEDLIEAYRGTVSLPFEPGTHRRVAVKIVDDRGIESLKIVQIPE